MLDFVPPRAARARPAATPGAVLRHLLSTWSVPKRPTPSANQHRQNDTGPAAWDVPAQRTNLPCAGGAFPAATLRSCTSNPFTSRHDGTQAALSKPLPFSVSIPLGVNDYIAQGGPASNKKTVPQAHTNQVQHRNSLCVKQLPPPWSDYIRTPARHRLQTTNRLQQHRRVRPCQEDQGAKDP